MHGQQFEQFTEPGRAFGDALLGHQPSIVVDYGDVVMLSDQSMPHHSRIPASPLRPSGGHQRYRSSQKRMRVALMTRTQRPAIAPVVRNPQRPTAPTVLLRAQRPRSAKL
jgi:hypothetical protein